MISSLTAPRIASTMLRRTPKASIQSLTGSVGRGDSILTNRHSTPSTAFYDLHQLQLRNVSSSSHQKNYQITPDVKHKLEEGFSRHKYDPSGNDAYIHTMRELAYSVLPSDLLSSLSAFRTLDSPHAYMIIDGLPVDKNITGSPRAGELGSQYKNGEVTENLLVGIASIVGEPYSIAHEGSGLVNNLVPSKKSAGQYTGLGFDVELSLHSENAMQARQPEGDTSPTELLLYGVRGEPTSMGPNTKITDGRAALKLLSPDTKTQLRLPEYKIKAPYRWRSSLDSSGLPTSILSPVLTGPESAPRITVAFYPDMVDGINQKAQKALENFHEALEESSVGIPITPGRLAVINNRYSLHAREKFDATFDENDNAHRWIQRVFTRPTLWNFRQYHRLHDRVLDPLKSEMN